MVAIPEVKLINRESQKAAAKIGLVVYDAKTKRILGEGGTSTSTSDDSSTEPGQRTRELPTQVTFGRPQTDDRPGRVRITGGERE